MNKQLDVRRLVLASLMAALIAVGGYLVVPIGPVPIVLQNLFVLLAGLLLGSKWASASVAVYLLAGACGLPVFAGGGGGLGHLFGPRGGYLFGFLAAAWLVGRIAESAGGRRGGELIALLVGSLTIYAIGVPWLQFLLGLSFGKALAVGMYPFILGDLLKVAAALVLVRKIRPLLNLSDSAAPAGARLAWADERDDVDGNR